MLSPHQWGSINDTVTINTTTNVSIPRQLPPFLNAPRGWRSEIIHSNSPLPIDNEVNFTHTNNYHSYIPTNNTVVINRNRNGNLLHQQQSYLNEQQQSYLNQHQQSHLNQHQQSYLNQHQQSFLNEQQQRNIVNIVETQNPPPLFLRKTLPNNLVTYKQNVSVRYLQPPPPPPPGPIIIREVRPPQPPPLPPIKIRQRPARPPTPPPIILRERPPALPPQTPAQVIEKLLPPPPQAPRRVILERFAACPPKPSDVIIERWLPYKKPGQRRVLVEQAPPPNIVPQEPNLVVLYDSPNARIHRHFINQGVIRADPETYFQQYGTELHSTQLNSQNAVLLEEATRAVPPPPIIDYEHERSPSPYILNTAEKTRVVSPIPRSSSAHILNTLEKTRVVSPIPRSSSYHYYDQSYSRDGYGIPPHYCNQSVSRYEYDRPSHYYDQSYSRQGYNIPPHYCNQSYSRYGYDYYPRYHENYRTMVDITPSWDRHCHSSSYYQPCLTNPSETIHVRSENEFHHVLSELTNGHIPSTLNSY